MGYEESLYSIKSRIFVCSVHSEAKCKLKICDAITSGIHQIAQRLVLQDTLENLGPSRIAKEDENCVVFSQKLKYCYGANLGIINKKDVPIQVTIDMSDTEDTYFTPSNGTVTMKIAPSAMSYICSTISNPSSERVNPVIYTFTSEEIEAEEEETKDEEEE